MNKIFAFLSIALLASQSLSAQQTKLLTAEKHNEYGLVYSLPLTAFRVDVVAVKENKVAGPYSKYSKIFTAEENVISENSVKWSIESIRVTPFGMPDEENMYLMQLKPGATTYIGVAKDGMLLSINTSPDEEAVDKVEFLEIEGNPSTGKEYLEFVNEDFTAAISSYKQAQLLAEEIMEVRDAKISLTRGTAETMPTDGRQLEIMLGSLEQQEKALVNAFTGNSWKERVVKTYEFLPNDAGRSIVCRLNDAQGLIDSKNKDGEPLYFEVKVIEEPALPVDAKGEEKKIPKDAVMYNIPGTAEISLSFGGRKLYEEILPMSQFGIQFGLNPSIFTDKKEPSYAIFDSTTGALKELGAVKE